MGGDYAPEAVLGGVKLALATEPALQLILTGPSEVLDSVTVADFEGAERIELVATTEVIAMDEHPAEAVRTKKDSSIVVGCKLVAEGRAEGFFSAGSTGAVMAAATIGIGRIKGISRPMIATLLPTAIDSQVVLADVGANADVKPEYLFQFALMGEAYARTALGVAAPRVGLLNIGEEDTKGNELAQAAYALLTERLPGFAGNAEGTDILSGRFDVIVTDGFSGNIALKTIEGATEFLLRQFVSALRPALEDEAVAHAVLPVLQQLQAGLSADEVGAAPLLGIQGSCYIGHGSSSAKAIASGILATHRGAEARLPEVIAKAVAS
jgi:glycerol-3-phosphate acyltransferase PlsX